MMNFPDALNKLPVGANVSYSDTELDVYLEGQQSRTLVGRLQQTQIAIKKAVEYVFTYDKKYIYLENALPLGPEFPLTSLEHKSEELFASVGDRIPSRENPAYVEYCRAAGISEKESNPIVLLRTIGRKGPSSFIFEPVVRQTFGPQELKIFRKELCLSIREFADAFDTSFASVQRIESGRTSGRDVLKRIEIYCRFCEVALIEVEKNRARLHSKVYKRLRERLEQKPSASESARPNLKSKQ